MGEQESKVELYDYKKGVKDGIPIALGYLPLAVAFGIFATKSGFGFWIVQVMNALIYSTTGQFAALNTIQVGQEIAIFTCALMLFVAQFRYVLLSISMAQRLGSSMGTFKRFLFGILNTDEIYILAMRKKGTLEAPYLFGIATAPYSVWLVGCVVGFFCTNILPVSIASALGIIIYGMLIAMIVPSVKKSRPMLFAALIAVVISVAIENTPVKSALHLTNGWVIIICTVVTALICALLFPVKDESEVKEGAE